MKTRELRLPNFKIDGLFKYARRRANETLGDKTTSHPQRDRIFLLAAMDLIEDTDWTDAVKARQAIVEIQKLSFKHETLSDHH